MAARDARQIYADLARYFGLREQDAFLSAIEQAPAGAGPTSRRSNKEKFFGEIFGDGTGFADDDTLFKLLEAGYDKADKDICITSTSNKVPTIVQNKQAVDQGAGKESGIFGMKDILGGKSAAGNVTAYQIFPAARGVDITDTEIITLFLSSLTSLEMSRAIPYIDIAISTKSSTDKEGNFTKDSHLSLGRFLGAGTTEMALRGKFLGHVGKANTFASDTEANLQPAASMEIFTTPQTLVNAKNVSYDENVGGPIDAFRPFLDLGSLEITVTPSSFGTIAYKSAKLSLKLYDRGRLADIAPLVSPQRKGNVQFYITYGWAHPDGLTVERRSDAAGKSVIGDLINAMKLSEAFIVTNSSFSFGSDGVVSIDVDLAMVGTDIASGLNILDAGSGRGVQDVINLMNNIQKKMTELQKIMPSADIPQVIVGTGPENILDLSPGDVKKLQAAVNKLGKSGSLKDVGRDLTTVLGNGNNSLKKAQAGVAEFITKVIDQFKTTPDPFLRPWDNKKKVSQKSHVSFGKLMSFYLQHLSKDDTDVQIVFTPFNYSAGCMYDHNISQFPIELESLKRYLITETKKRQKISLMGLLQFLEKYFLSFQGYEAFGLGAIYERDPKTGISTIKEKLKEEIEKKGNQGSFNNLMHTQLLRIYGNKRIRPTFTPPQVTMSIVTRKSPAGKNITRVTFFDAVCGQVMPIIDAFNSAAQSGHFVIEELNGKSDSRGARHNETATATYAALKDEELIALLEPKNIDEMVEKYSGDSKAGELATKEFKKRLQATRIFKFGNARSKLKNLFFRFAPSLIYGTVGSGILTADLASQQNDALLSIALVDALNGREGEPTKENVSLPLMVHPTTLKLSTFGCPLFRFSQKFFVDLGTNTSADNFYAVVGISHSISKGDFKTSVDLIQTDAYGSFIHIGGKIEDTIVSVAIADLANKKSGK